MRLHTEDLFPAFWTLRDWIQHAIRCESKLQKISQMEDRSSRSKVPAELKWSKNMEDNQKGFIQHFVSIRQCCKWKGGDRRCISDSNRFLHALHVRVCCSLLASRITKSLGYTKWSHIACCIEIGALNQVWRGKGIKQGFFWHEPGGTVMGLRPMAQLNYIYTNATCPSAAEMGHCHHSHRMA